MTTLSDRLSVVRPQWEAQLDAFRTLTTRALDSAEQLFALNMKTSLASIEQANGAVQQMLRATDPRDLLAIGSQAQGQWQHMFTYSRELMDIALGMRERSWSSIPLPGFSAPLQLTGVPAPAALAVEQAGIAIADATTVHSEIAAAAVDTSAALAEDTLGVGDQSATGDGDEAALQPAAQIAPAAAPAAVPDDAPADAPTELAAEKTGEAPSEAPADEPADEPAAKPEAKPEAKAEATAATLDEETSANVDALVDIVIANEAPPVKAKPLVEALNEVVPKPVSVEHPIISTVPLEAGDHVALPLVTPADATPPVAPSNGAAPAERRRTSRKKS
jgi:hypothetical protein